VRSTKRWWLVALLALGAVLLIAQQFLARRPRAESEPTAQTDGAAEPVPSAPAPARRTARTPPPRAARPSDPCTGTSAVRCHRGDVWAFDTCGRPDEKLEECEERSCDVDTCAPEPELPCPAPSEGRCVGDVVELCLGGLLQRVDCAARGARCLSGREGATCGPRIPQGEACSGADRCDGDVLVTCRDSRLQRTPCAAFGATCAALSGRPARCLEQRPVPLQLDCGPCGCPHAQGERACDGRDEDGDSVIDEGVDCGPVPVVAFVVGDDRGATSHADEDIDDELARLNVLFAGTPGALRFVLRERVSVDDGRLVELDEAELDALGRAPEIVARGDGFYVPLVFTERVLSEGGVPKAGMSPLPNGTCGGVMMGGGPELGAVAVAKGRSPTTVAHELGHYFGLCHTHELLGARVSVAKDERGALRVCSERCADEGDGICDTALDPGVDACGLDPTCTPHCPAAEAAPVDNLMSYYTPCRRAFTPEQRGLMARTLALRRAWAPCLRGPCACAVSSDCPAGMGCRPTREGSPQCALAGQYAAKAPCGDSRDCGPSTLCVGVSAGSSARCARLCTVSGPGCTCSELGDGLGICREDAEP
jgi:Pregnancy-associated plasma protein-A